MIPLSYLFESVKISNVKYLNELDELRIPKNKVLIGGSGTLALYGLRENKDLDVTVPLRIYNQIKSKHKLPYTPLRPGEGLISYKNVDLHHTNWPFKISVEEELKKCIVVNGYHFMSLKRLIEWKKIVNRPKDKQDIKLIMNSGLLKEEVINEEIDRG